MTNHPRSHGVKFRVGQVVAVRDKPGFPHWFGTVVRELDGRVKVAYPDGDLEYSIGDLRPLTKKEAGR